MADPYKVSRSGTKRAKQIMKAAGGDVGADATPFSTAAQRGKRTTGKAAAKEMRSMESQAKVPGRKGAKRFARGGKVRKGHTTNVIIAAPHPGAGGQPPMTGGPMPPQPGGPPPMGAPPMPMGGMGGPGMPPPGLRPGMPPQGMARGGAANMTAGAFSGVGREQKAGRRRGET